MTRMGLIEDFRVIRELAGVDDHVAARLVVAMALHRLADEHAILAEAARFTSDTGARLLIEGINGIDSAITTGANVIGGAIDAPPE